MPEFEYVISAFQVMRPLTPLLITAATAVVHTEFKIGRDLGSEKWCRIAKANIGMARRDTAHIRVHGFSCSLHRSVVIASARNDCVRGFRQPLLAIAICTSV
jgi:hypothetical protein